jgi:probable rRNA maturation factor
MEALLQHIEASAEADLPPRSWQAVSQAAETLAAHALPGISVALLVCGDARIRALNRLHRGVDKSTDVLSFPAGGLPAHGGDIALNWQATLRQARHNGNSPEAEAAALIAHGLLHLAGYDHDTAGAEAAMNERTVELCRLAGYEVTRFGH